jgi:exosortase
LSVEIRCLSFRLSQCISRPHAGVATSRPVVEEHTIRQVRTQFAGQPAKISTPVKPAARNHISYTIVIAASLLAGWQRFASVLAYGWSHDSSSHILLVPIVSFYLVWRARDKVFAATGFSPLSGTFVIMGGCAVLWAATRERLHLHGNESLVLAALSLVVVWIGGFLLCYGPKAFRAAMFPLSFLLLMVPFPDPVEEWMVHLLQQGSTEATYLLFKVLSVPVFRRGFLLSVPGVTIEVAKECSSIRSSVALVITCLVAGHLSFRTGWRTAVLVALALPLSVIKNGIRIVTLTLLSIYVDPSFLHGRLHRDGGFVFFLLALGLLFPIFHILEKSQRAAGAQGEEDGKSLGCSPQR